MNHLRHVYRVLMIIFFVPLILSILLIILFENDMLSVGIWTGKNGYEFVCLSVMEILTICLAPLALRLFKLKHIQAALHQNKKQAAKVLLKWGSIRLLMIEVPLIVNLLLYYFFMKVAFGYMAIILFLCMFFVFPSLDRCINETTEHQ